MALNAYKKEHFGEEKLQRLQDNIEQFVRQLYGFSRYPIGLDSVRIPKAKYYVSSSELTKIVVPGSEQVPATFQVANELYVITKNLTCDVSTTGFNALDTGSIASGTIYYLYAVKLNDTIGLVCSLRYPNEGPFGYRLYTYLGSLSTKSGTAEFNPGMSADGQYISDDILETQAHTGDTTVTAKTYSSLPDSANFAYVGLKVTGTIANSSARVGGTDSVTNPAAVESILQVSGVGNVVYGWVPVVESGKIYLKVDNASNTATCNLLGWKESPGVYQ